MTQNYSIYDAIVSKLSFIKKRRRFILGTVLLTVIITFSTFFKFQSLTWVVPLLILAVYGVTFFSILDGISDSEWFLLFIHPIMFTIALFLFYFFLPGRWLTRLPFAVIYSISIYAILLSQNIFNVGVERSLQLFRAASSVNFLYLTITMFISLSLLFAFHMNFLINGLATFILAIPTSMQFIWSVNPQARLEREVVKQSIFVASILGEVAIIFSFVPISPPMFALLVTSLFYSILGLLQAYLQGRLFKEVIREYVFVICFIGVIVLLSLQW